jgi:catechol 2,3-dioxygenase-like lactoylglutathione lyase family enzyme
MLPNKLGVVMITVSDMERSVAFYRDTLGLPLRFQSPEWSEFATEGVTLALHGGGAPRTGAPVGGPPQAGRVSTGWGVDDLAAVYAALKAKGVRFVMEPTTREGEGIRLAVFLDPDGCALSLAQVL